MCLCSNRFRQKKSLGESKRNVLICVFWVGKLLSEKWRVQSNKKFSCHVDQASRQIALSTLVSASFRLIQNERQWKLYIWTYKVLTGYHDSACNSISASRQRTEAVIIQPVSEFLLLTFWFLVIMQDKRLSTYLFPLLAIRHMKHSGHSCAHRKTCLFRLWREQITFCSGQNTEFHFLFHFLLWVSLKATESVTVSETFPSPQWMSIQADWWIFFFLESHEEERNIAPHKFRFLPYVPQISELLEIGVDVSKSTFHGQNTWIQSSGCVWPFAVKR